MTEFNRYEIAAALIEAQADVTGDDAGWHHVVIGVLRDLNDADESGQGDRDVIDAVYDRIVSSLNIKSFAMPPGVVDPKTGRYNPGDDE